MKKIFTRLVISIFSVLAVIYAVPFFFYCLGQLLGFIGFLISKFFDFISIYFEEVSAVLITGLTIILTFFAIIIGFAWTFGLMDEEQKQG